MVVGVVANKRLQLGHEKLWRSFVEQITRQESPETNPAVKDSSSDDRQSTSFCGADDGMKRTHSLRNELKRVGSNLSQSSRQSVGDYSTTSESSIPSAEPNRLVDFFCVIGTEHRLLRDNEAEQHTKERHNKSSKGGGSSAAGTTTSYAPLNLKSPSQLRFRSSVRDCHPKSQPGMEFPQHIHIFANPNGFFPVAQSTPPPATIMTLVLTSSNGKRLYGAVLKLYDECITHRELEEIVIASSSVSVPTSWKHVGRTQRYYLPTCLVVLSHHALFDVYRRFLQQLYRVYKSGCSPLPIERYIANFMHDVPLPPKGRVCVEWECFTKGNFISISRPAPNQLPLVNFSYQPLLSALSVSNILTVWGILLQEGRVALSSQYPSLLTPVAQALISLLYPLEWQGMYIPVLPSGMEDILDAPVPFLVGIMNNNHASRRRGKHDGVVVVDLDEDMVHLGMNDDGLTPRTMPDIPDACTMRLKVHLEALADELYLVPWCGIKGRMTSGESGEMVDNAVRQTYGQMTRLALMKPRKDENDHRHFILSNAERAFLMVSSDDTPHHDEYHGLSCELKRVDFLTSRPEEVRHHRQDGDNDRGEKRRQEDKDETRSESPPNFLPHAVNVALKVQGGNMNELLKIQGRAVQAHLDKFMSVVGQKYATSHAVLDPQLKRKRLEIAKRFYDVDMDCDVGVRSSFLRFFTSIFLHYSDYVHDDGPAIRFDKDSFLASLKISSSNREYMLGVVETQMFERFLQERQYTAHHQKGRISIRRSNALLFDEYRNKQKRSALTLLWGNKNLASNNTKTSGGPPATMFLDDQRWKLRKVLSPAAPCAWGVLWGSNYRYDKFPKLREREFVANNTPDSLNKVLCGSTTSLC